MLHSFSYPAWLTKASASLQPFGPAFAPPPQPIASELAIRVCDLDLVYDSQGQSFQALQGVSLDVAKGAVQMVAGPSGAGKTTLLLVLAGLLRPTQGQVELLGYNITQMQRRQLDRFRLHHLGLMFQDGNLLRSLTALENVEVVLQLKGIHGHEAKDQALQLLEAVGLGKFVHQLPRQLSGGQQQRVAVARSLAGAPSLIFADEPTAALDSKNGQMVVEAMRRLAKEQGCTVLIATHDPRILDLADRVVHLDDGHLQEGDRATATMHQFCLEN